MAHLFKVDKLINYIHNVDTSFTKEAISTTVEYYPGTEVTYTPTTGSSKVVYEISYYAEKINGYHFSLIQLEEYDAVLGSWSEINEKYRHNIGNWNVSQSQRWYFHFRYVIPAWSGSKQLRINNKTYSSSSGSLSVHEMTEWDGSSATNKFCNTNLLVYSI